MTEVVAIEPEPALRTEAEAAGERVPVAYESRRGVADALPLDEGSADIAVASLVLCSVPHQPAALAELRPALRPGGRNAASQLESASRGNRRGMILSGVRD